ncbi:MAG: YlbF family regulator [Clostridia bacterium]|nr:YlbF family regulator [Clostridia bacterium]
MNTEMLKQPTLDAIHQLGQMLKEDSRAATFLTAEHDYVTSPALNRLLAEYNANQAALAAEYGKGEEMDKEVISAIENRLNELYDGITGDASYDAYVRAKEDYDAMMETVVTELQYAITGERPCTHDCSTCGGCH